MKNGYELYLDGANDFGVGIYKKTPKSERLVGIAYTTWHSDSFTEWGGGTWSLPLDGKYDSDDPDVIYKHGILLRDAGVDFVFVDWSNNTAYDPLTMRERRSDFRMIEEATDVLFRVWSKIENAPKIALFIGPGHSGQIHVDNGDQDRKAEQVYRDYVLKYPELYFSYEGKPLLMCYGATPNLYGVTPKWNDERFTVRWVTGYIAQQGELFDQSTYASYGFWSWEERGVQPYSVHNGYVESVTVTAASRSQGKEGYRRYIPAIPRDGGRTFARQFERARLLGARIALIVSWNEWVKGEQPSLEISKDIEPSEAYGDLYVRLMKDCIARFKSED